MFFSLELTFDITHTTHKDTQHTQQPLFALGELNRACFNLQALDLFSFHSLHCYKRLFYITQI